jgi:hypothetical protein
LELGTNNSDLYFSLFGHVGYLTLRATLGMRVVVA